MTVTKFRPNDSLEEIGTHRDLRLKYAFRTHLIEIHYMVATNRGVVGNRGVY